LSGRTHAQYRMSTSADMDLQLPCMSPSLQAVTAGTGCDVRQPATYALRAYAVIGRHLRIAWCVLYRNDHGAVPQHQGGTQHADLAGCDPLPRLAPGTRLVERDMVILFSFGQCPFRWTRLGILRPMVWGLYGSSARIALPQFCFGSRFKLPSSGRIWRNSRRAASRELQRP
jgi:hypothetical protein